jgi:hypothetical protein
LISVSKTEKSTTVSNLGDFSMTKPKKRDLQSFRYRAIAAAAALVLSGAAMAQTSEGSIFGRANAGATVTITNVDTNVTRQVKAEADGSFNFSRLAPGKYKVVSAGANQEVQVSIGTGSEVNLTASTLQKVEVVGQRGRASIDMSSVESNSVYSAEQIRQLPVARNTNAVALLAPGTVKGDGFGDGLTLPSFGGASIAENGYYINGLDVTNIRNFLTYAQVPTEGVAETQVKTGGYGAEYGRSLGGVVSVATKRGTNEWKGGASFFFEPKSLRGKAKDAFSKDPDTLGNPTVFESADKENKMTVLGHLGGPIIKDRLFFYALVEAPNDKTTDFRQDQAVVTTDKQPNALLKLDWSITDKHQLEFTGITTKRKVSLSDYDNAKPFSTTLDGDPKLSSRKGGGEVLSLKYTGYLTDNLTVSALAGRVTELVNKTTGAREAGKDCPVVLEVDLSEIGCWAGPFPGLGAPDPLAPPNKDTRKSYRLDGEYVLGAHTLRAGIDNQVFTSAEAGGSSYTGGFYYRYFRVGANGVVNSVPGFTPGSQYVRRRILQNTSGEYDVRNSAFYLEDSWKLNSKLTIYGGLRIETFDNRNGDGESFVKRANLLAPRAGFAFDPTEDASGKIYANFGRYYIPVASNTNIRATRGEIFTQSFFTFASRDPRTQGPVGLSAEIGNPQVTSSGALPNVATVADTKLRPMNQDELILGFQKAAFDKQWSFGVKGVYRKINDGMDDYCDHTRVAAYIASINPGYKDNLATCMLMNPGRDLNIKVDLKGDKNLTDVTIPSSALGLAKYSRTYKALEFSVDKRFNGTYALQGSYTLSQSKGTAEGYVQSQLDQRDAGLTQDFDFGSFTDGSKGYLPNDRRHVLKVQGLYQVAPEFRLGLNATVSSGRPISCIGFVPPTVPDFAGASAYSSASSYYCIKDPNKGPELVSRGSAGRTPWTSTFDMSFAYIPAWAGKGLTLQMDVFNIFNSRKTTEVNEVRDFSRQDSNATTPPYRVSPNYLNPTSFQDPRSVRFQARYEF